MTLFIVFMLALILSPLFVWYIEQERQWRREALQLHLDEEKHHYYQHTGQLWKSWTLGETPVVYPTLVARVYLP